MIASILTRSIGIVQNVNESIWKMVENFEGSVLQFVQIENASLPLFFSTDDKRDISNVGTMAWQIR